MTPLKAIKEKYIDCNCGQKHEVKLCTVTECPLYQFRFGHGPKRRLSEDQKRALVARFGKSSINNNTPIK